MVINQVNQSTSDFILLVNKFADARREKKFLAVFRLIDKILSFLGTRYNPKNFVGELEKQLHDVMQEGGRRDILLTAGITLSVDTNNKTASLKDHNGLESTIPYNLLIAICLNSYPIEDTLEGFVNTTVISYKVGEAEDEIEQFLKDQSRGVNCNTTVNYSNEKVNDINILTKEKIDFFAKNLITYRAKQNKNEDPVLFFDNFFYKYDDIYRIASVCNQGFLTSLTNNVCFGIRKTDGMIHIANSIDTHLCFYNAGIPDEITARVLNRSSLPKESPVKHYLTNNNIISVWSNVGLPVFDVKTQVWEYTECNVTISDFRDGQARLSVNIE